MLEEARNEKLKQRIKAKIQGYKVSKDITYTTQEKDGVYQCVIRFKKNEKWDQFWATTSYKVIKGNLRIAKKRCDEIADIFKEVIEELENDTQKNDTGMSIIEFQELTQLNTTNYNKNKITKADWDFYEYMEFWLYKIIKNSVQEDTFSGYKRNVTKWMKAYFTMPKNKRKVKELTADDLDDFYEYCRENNLKNASIDHFNDNISNAFKYLLRKKLVRYNPTEQITPLVVEVIEVDTYNQEDIKILMDTVKGEAIELPTLFDIYYGLRRSEIIGLRKSVFDFENNIFIINHVAIQLSGKEYKERVDFQDRTKSKKGCRILPLFPEVKEAVLKKLERIEQNKIIFGNEYNYEFDDYICVQDNGDLIKPSYFTKRMARVIKKNKLKKITPHGLRHSIATLLHIAGVDIRDLQDWLGHENINSTNRYTRSDYKKQVSTGGVVLQLFSDNNNEEVLENKKEYSYAR